MTRSSKRTLPRPRAGSRSLRFERLESRALLAGDTFLMNFQLAGAPIPTRYLADTGQMFGLRDNGLAYGWSSDHTDQSRDRGLNLDQRLDTLIHFEVGQSWEFQLANGNYEVTVSIGDAQFDSTHTLNVEGVNFWNAVPLTPSDFRSMTQQITVSDGRLTLNQGAAPDKATRINFIHIVGIPTGPNAAPSAPTITEPADAAVINPSDVHMEAVGYLDADGNAHQSTDWEIWTVGPGAQPVWQTLGITGIERLHTHLGDGVFINSHAGRSSLLGETQYELRVRFRDDAGSVSAYATRAFETTSASAIAPLELTDIDTLPTPYWVNHDNSSIELPNPGPTPPQLRFESAAGDLLVRVTGQTAAGNAVDNPFPLDEHVQVRIVIESGSNPLSLTPTNFIIYDELGTRYDIHLPVVNLAAGQRLDLWVAFNGSTYYGTASQTEPDFTNLARASDIVFAAFQPGFIVEEVAGGFQLPVNIAFVPNPGPDPNDPLFYVNELYGTIKVVTREYTVSTYATGLLNFNPTGAFPGSGEQGLAGIVVDPVTGDLFVTRVTSSTPGVEAAPHYPQVVRLSSTDGGLTASSITVIRDMVGETMGQSHQISNVTIGPDGKLYVHVGDGFDYTTAQNLNSYRGKVLRMNFDGSAPSDNPFYNAVDGINAADYVFAYGLRNPFGGAWRTSDGKHYEVENGPSRDRLAQINRGVNYGWNNTDASMSINAIYVWNPARAPVNIDFIQSTTFAGSQFPASKLDHAFVSESGSTYAIGQQTLGKRIVEFTINAAGALVAGPTPLVQYTGVGYGTVCALTAGPDGLYFSELYKDLNASSPIDPGARVFRVRYIDNVPGDYNIDGTVNAQDHAQFTKTFGSNVTLAADGNNDGTVDAADYVLWRKLAAAGGSGGIGVDVGQAVPDTFTLESSSGGSVAQAVATGTPSLTAARASKLAAALLPWQRGPFNFTSRKLAASHHAQAAARDNALILALRPMRAKPEYASYVPTSEDYEGDSSNDAFDDVFASFASLRINLE